MAEKLQNEAAKIAALLVKQGKSCLRGDELRDVIDSKTGSDLDCVELDILQGMVEGRLAKHTLTKSEA